MIPERPVFPVSHVEDHHEDGAQPERSASVSNNGPGPIVLHMMGLTRFSTMCRTKSRTLASGLREWLPLLL